jgi:3-hydroxyisobutyrate dehydrogenase-like beta-hydroxyacid dehydrogenase
VAKVGFVGLGIMGAPMAAHLVAAGHDVAVWSHTAAKAARFSDEHGCGVAATPADLGRMAESIFLCVGNTAQSREVILGESGLIEGASEGSLIIDCSTIAPSASRLIALELSKKKIRFLDAPCTGSKAGAESGSLTFMIGGDRTTFDEARHLFEAMGKSFYYCGGQGMGLHAKITQNLMLGNILQAFNEGLVLSSKAGIDPEIMIEILSKTGARSGYVDGKAGSVLARNFATTFSVRWMEKDLGLALETGADLGVPLTLTAVSQQALRTAIARGYGEDDICGSIRALEEIASCTVKAGINTATAQG